MAIGHSTISKSVWRLASFSCCGRVLKSYSKKNSKTRLWVSLRDTKISVFWPSEVFILATWIIKAEMDIRNAERQKNRTRLRQRKWSTKSAIKMLIESASLGVSNWLPHFLWQGGVKPIWWSTFRFRTLVPRSIIIWTPNLSCSHSQGMSAFCMLSLWKSKTTAQTCPVSTDPQTCSTFDSVSVLFAAFLCISSHLHLLTKEVCPLLWRCLTKALSQQTRNSKSLHARVPRGPRQLSNLFGVSFACDLSKCISKFAASCPRTFGWESSRKKTHFTTPSTAALLPQLGNGSKVWRPHFAALSRANPCHCLEKISQSFFHPKKKKHS